MRLAFPILAACLLAGCASVPTPSQPIEPVAQAQQHTAVAAAYITQASESVGVAAGYLTHAGDTLGTLATTVPAANVPSVVSASNDVAAAQAALRQAQTQAAMAKAQTDEINALLVATTRQVAKLNDEHAKAIATEQGKTRDATKRAEKAEGFWGYRWGKTIDHVLIAIVAVGVPLLIAGIWFSISTHNVGTVAGILKKFGGWLWSIAVSRFTQKATTQ